MGVAGASALPQYGQNEIAVLLVASHASMPPRSLIHGIQGSSPARAACISTTPLQLWPRIILSCSMCGILAVPEPARGLGITAAVQGAAAATHPLVDDPGIACQLGQPGLAIQLAAT